MLTSLNINPTLLFAHHAQANHRFVMTSLRIMCNAYNVAWLGPGPVADLGRIQHQAAGCQLAQHLAHGLRARSSMLLPPSAQHGAEIEHLAELDLNLIAREGARGPQRRGPQGGMSLLRATVATWSAHDLTSRPLCFTRRRRPKRLPS